MGPMGYLFRAQRRFTQRRAIPRVLSVDRRCIGRTRVSVTSSALIASDIFYTDYVSSQHHISIDILCSPPRRDKYERTNRYRREWVYSTSKTEIHGWSSRMVFVLVEGGAVERSDQRSHLTDDHPFRLLACWRSVHLLSLHM